MDLTTLFKSLVQIDSVSGYEQEVSDFVMQYLKSLNLNPVQDRNQMIYCRVGEGANPSLFCAHMDTVEPGRGIKVIEKNGYLKSEGQTILGADNKVSVATILYSVSSLLKASKTPNIELLFSVREETDSGISEFDVSQLKSKVGFVFDAGNGDLSWLTSSAPTLEDFIIEIFGKSSHASHPEEGINALEILTTALSELKIGRLDSDTTFNIGLISGGNATNTVPEKITLKGDLRSNNSTSYKKYKKAIIEKFNEVAKSFKAEVRLTWIPYSVGYVQNLESNAYKNLCEIYWNFGIKINPRPTTSGSDASFLNNSGIETFCLGSPDENAHTIHERVDVKNLIKFQKIVEKLMSDFAKAT